MKLLSELVIVISIVSIIKTEGKKVEGPEFHWHDWYLSYDSDGNHLYCCSLTFIASHVALTEAKCIEESLRKFPHNHIGFNLATASNIMYSYNFNESLVYYNEDFAENYDPSKRNIAIIIGNKSLVHNDRELLNLEKKISPEKYPNQYNGINMLAHLPDNNDDVDFSNCFVPLFNTSLSVIVGPCSVSHDEKTLSCAYNLTELPFEYGRERYKKVVLCNSKHDPNDKFLVGVLKAREWILNRGLPFLGAPETENVSDLKHVISRKLKELSVPQIQI